MAILAFEDDVGVGGVGAVVDGEHDDGAVVADDVLDVAMAVGLFERVGEDVEDAAFEGEFGGDELWRRAAGLGRGFGLAALAGRTFWASLKWRPWVYGIILHRGGEYRIQLIACSN